VSAAHLAAAITTAASMGIRDKERVCDRIYAAQPNLLGSVLAQRSLGVSMPTIDILLNILIVLYLAIEESGQVLAIVSEADQERELQRFAAAVRFTEGLGATHLPGRSSKQRPTGERSSCSPMLSTSCSGPGSRTCGMRRPSIPSWWPLISSTASRPRGARCHSTETA
jgi:hypothetical protein